MYLNVVEKMVIIHLIKEATKNAHFCCASSLLRPSTAFQASHLAPPLENTHNNHLVIAFIYVTTDDYLSNLSLVLTIALSE